MSRSCEPGSSLYLLAENFKKLEKEREKKSGRMGWNLGLGDKLKSARKSSKKLSNYAFSKLGEGQEQLRRRLKRNPKDTPMVLREAHSDTEEDTLSSQSTPLLFSMSASSQNLSSTSMGNDGPPPPKPPRTFKTKQLNEMTVDCPDSEGEEDELIFNDDLTSNILSAIKEVGVAYSFADGKSVEGIANGCIPSSTATSDDSQHVLRSDSSPQPEYSANHNLMRSESSPQLSRSNLTSAPAQNEEQGSSDTSPRLQTISEDYDSAHTNNDLSQLPSPLSVRSDETDSPISLAEVAEDHLVQSVSSCSTKDPTSLVDDFNASISPTEANVNTSFGTPPEQDHTLQEPDSTLNKRFSILSTASAEFYSAESSEGSPSPDLPDKSSVLPLSSSAAQVLEDPDLRALSSLSVEDENFNTPPSSPLHFTSHSPDTKDRSSTLTSNQVDKSVTATPTSPFSSSSPTPTHGNTDILTPRHVTDSFGPYIGNDDYDGVFFSVVESGKAPEEGKEEKVEVEVRNQELESTLEGGKSTLEGENRNQELESTLEEKIACGNGHQELELTLEEKVEGGNGNQELKSILEEKVEGENRNQELESILEPCENKETPMPAEPTPPTLPKSRMRSLTVSLETGMLPIRGKSLRRGTCPITSMDDNFETEFEQRLSCSDGLMSYFSQQDLEDIFKGKGLFGGDKIETVKEGEEEEGVVVVEKEGVAEVGVEGTEENAKEETLEEVKTSEESPSRNSHVTTPDITPTIIPDDIPPNMVKDHHNYTHPF